MAQPETGPSPVVQLVECPRDALQGWPYPLSTASKAAYFQTLLRVGFHTLDFGSFVSAKLVPQMADTPELLDLLDLGGVSTRLLAIVANQRGALRAARFPQIADLGYPFSLAPSFQYRNTGQTQEQSLETLRHIAEICREHQKNLVLYFSMAFGNPDRDLYEPGMVGQWMERVIPLGIRTVSLADTLGLASAGQIALLCSRMIRDYPQINFGVHLHARSSGWEPKVAAAYLNGCRRFDGALKGIGGCPFAGDELIGNIATENLVSYLKSTGVSLGLNAPYWSLALQEAECLFSPGAPGKFPLPGTGT